MANGWTWLTAVNVMLFSLLLSLRHDAMDNSQRNPELEMDFACFRCQHWRDSLCNLTAAVRCWDLGKSGRNHSGRFSFYHSACDLDYCPVGL